MTQQNRNQRYMYLVKSCPIRTSLLCPRWVFMHFNVITPLDHIIVSDVASHFPVNFAELLCNQVVFGTEIQSLHNYSEVYLKVSLSSFWPLNMAFCFWLNKRLFCLLRL